MNNARRYVRFMLLPRSFRPHIKPIFQGIAAKAGRDPCCDWVSEGDFVNSHPLFALILTWDVLGQIGYTQQVQWEHESACLTLCATYLQHQMVARQQYNPFIEKCCCACSGAFEVCNREQIQRGVQGVTTPPLLGGGDFYVHYMCLEIYRV